MIEMNTNDTSILVKPTNIASLKTTIELYIQLFKAGYLNICGEISHCFYERIR